MDYGAKIVVTNLDGKTPLDEAFAYQASRDFDEYSKQMITVIEKKIIQIELKEEASTKNFIHIEDLYYKKALYKDYMIPISSVRNLSDYLYQIFEIENQF